MNRSRLLLIVAIIVLLVVLGLGGAVWWYLFGPNQVAAAQLVPADTIIYGEIPNAANIVAGYETSKLKTLIDSPNMKPAIDAIKNALGEKNLDVLDAFAPNLSGQSFTAITHFDPNKPDDVGFIAGLRPKEGFDHFDAFIEKLKATFPDLLKEAATGQDSVAGVNYQWIRPPGAAQKICVAEVGGWIITTWGQAPLQDWLERYQKKSSSPSLAENADYQKSLTRIGANPMTVVYFNTHVFLDAEVKMITKLNPQEADYFRKKFGGIGGIAVGTRFENGDIVDRVSALADHQVLMDSGVGAEPCPFETLGLTGPNTLVYWASSLDLASYWKSLVDQLNTIKPPNGPNPLDEVNSWAASKGLDFQRNVIDAIGHEVSFQLDWGHDTQYPEVGLIFKLAKPDDFQPTIKAILDAAHQATVTTAEIKDTKAGDQSFASLAFVQHYPVSPTITTNGPYFGIFLTLNQAVNAFTRTSDNTLDHLTDFKSQLGDKRTGASQIIYVDSPELVDHTYRTVLPMLSLASMFNADLANMLKGVNLPDDAKWLAPIGTWSSVTTPDADGLKGYSVSGIGNQGIFIVGGVAVTGVVLERLGMMMKQPGLIPGFGQATPPPPTAPPVPAPAPSSAPAPTPPAPDSTPAPDATMAPPAPTTPAPAPAPETTAPQTPPAPAPAPADTNATPPAQPAPPQ